MEVGLGGTRSRFRLLIRPASLTALFFLETRNMAGNSNSGRNSKFTPAIGGQICEIIEGGSHMSAACCELDIVRSTVHRWEKEFPEFHEAVRQARVVGAWALYDEIFDISDEMVEDTAKASRQRERLRTRM